MLLAVLQCGITGTFDALARHIGAPEHQVRQTLKNMRRAGQIDAIRAEHHHPHPQRARAIYAPARPQQALDALDFLRQAWR